MNSDTLILAFLYLSFCHFLEFIHISFCFQVQSEFQKAYEKGIHKSKWVGFLAVIWWEHAFPPLYKLLRLFSFRYWEPTYEDSLTLIAQVPIVAAYVYRRSVNYMKDHSLITCLALSLASRIIFPLGLTNFSCRCYLLLSNSRGLISCTYYISVWLSCLKIIFGMNFRNCWWDI